MKKAIAVLAMAAVMALFPSGALASNGASSHAPGLKIQQACGVSFGQLVSQGKRTGTAFNRNYAGGARAFSNDAILAAHGCVGVLPNQ